MKTIHSPDRSPPRPALHLNIDFNPGIKSADRGIRSSPFADDKPAEEVWVAFKPRSEDRFTSESSRTDKEGRFVLKIPAGAIGVVQASRYFSQYSHPNCDTILSLVKESGESLKTDEFEIDGTRGFTNAILRFPFDFCKEKIR